MNCKNNFLTPWKTDHGASMFGKKRLKSSRKHGFHGLYDIKRSFDLIP